MEIATKKFARFLLGFALIAFLSVAFFGMSQTMMGMEKRSDGTMGGCAFSGQAGICTMTFSEHLVYWQAMFATTAPQKALAFALLVLLAVVLVVIGIFKRNLLLFFNYRVTRWWLYIKNNSRASLFDPLKEALSQGILNPKIYIFSR